MLFAGENMEQGRLLKRSNMEVSNLLRSNIFLSKTIRQIVLMLGKPYPMVYASVKELERENT